MARDHARIYCRIWDDEEFIALPASAQHVYFRLLSDKNLLWCGVLTYVPGRFVGAAKDLSAPKLASAIRILKRERFLVADDTTGELLIRTFIKGDGVFDRANMGKACARHMRKIVSKPLLDALLVELARLRRDAPDLPGWAGFEDEAPQWFEEVKAMASEKALRVVSPKPSRVASRKPSGVASAMEPPEEPPEASPDAWGSPWGVEP